MTEAGEDIIHSGVQRVYLMDVVNVSVNLTLPWGCGNRKSGRDCAEKKGKGDIAPEHEAASAS